MIRISPAGAAVIAFALLAGCNQNLQHNAADPAAPASPDVQIVSFSPAGGEFDMAGTHIRAEPPEGFCIASDSLKPQENNIYFIYLRCDAPHPAPPGDAVSLSISTGPLNMDFTRLESFFASDAGRAGLGHGGGPEDVSLLETVRGPKAVYALVEDKSRAGALYEGEVIWRAFTEVKGRMSVITLISRRAGRSGTDEMRERVAQTVAALHAANGEV